MSEEAPPTLLVACGLTAEARIAKGANIRVIAGGGDSRGLRVALDAAARGAAGLVSFGIAGGLAPGLVPGARVVARGVVSSGGVSREAHPAWSALLAKRLGVPLVLFAGVDTPVADVAGKRALHSTAGAAVVDMETHVVADVAHRHGLPFVAIRVVSDAADHALPHAATVGMGPDGRVEVVAVLKSLVRDPRQLPALVGTARDARAAFAELLRCRQLLGDDFGLVDLGNALFDMP